MIEDLHSFSKKRPIIDLLRCLESKYHCTLDYKQVYYEIRKIKPLFGPEDCNNFINYLKSICSPLEYLVDDSNVLHKFIFATTAMKTNYKLFGDVLLLDATYKTNQYLLSKKGVCLLSRCDFFFFCFQFFFPAKVDKADAIFNTVCSNFFAQGSNILLKTWFIFFKCCLKTSTIYGLMYAYNYFRGRRNENQLNLIFHELSESI